MHRSPDLRARLAAAHRDDDSGFVLPLVLLVTMLVMIGTATMLAVVASNAVPARHSQDQETALAAAQAGVQAYVAQLNAHCTSYSAGECQWPYDLGTATARTVTSGSAGAPTLTGAAYTVAATNPQGFQSHNNDDLRVKSTGCVPGCTNPNAQTTLLADISGVPNVLRFTYFTNYESIDGTLLDSLYPAARSIALDGPTATLVGATSSAVQAAGGAVSWQGIANPSTCNQTWQGGRSTGSNDTATETPLAAPAGITARIDHTCSVTFSSGMKFTGPVYSADQLYLSNGVPGNTTGPSFSVPTPCSPTVTTSCEPLPPASSSATPAYRSFADPLGGQPAVAGSVQTSSVDVTLPGNANDATPTCTATGPNVTIGFSGTNASISNATGGTCGASVTVNHKTIEVQGNAYVSGDVSDTAGSVSVVAVPSAGAGGNIYVTGDVTTNGATTTNEFGENSYKSGSALALIATNNVVLQHDVKCAKTAPAGTTSGFCPDDITGMYTTGQANEVVNSDGTLKSTHPARQYCNKTGDTTCGSSADSACNSRTTTTRTVDAAIFALNGSFYTDNYNRGCALGTLQVTGGIYENHRGPLGQEWETPSTASTRSFSGYRLNLDYESLESAGLPYVPALQGGTANHPWLVVSVSAPRSGAGS